MDNIENAGRVLARGFGYGKSWDARYTFGQENWRPSVEVTAEVSLGGTWEEDESSAASDGLPVCRETETVQRAGESVSAWLGRPDADPRNLTREQHLARAKLSPDEQQTLWAWELANPLNHGQRRNPYRTRELEHWQRTKSGPGVQIVRPMHAMDQCALEALAGIAKPLQSILLLHATNDDRYWPIIERYARAVLPPEAHDGIAEGMFRLLKDPAKKTRAKELRMRVTDWDAMSRPALRLFESWLASASNTFAQQLTRPDPITGTQGNAHRSETWWRPPQTPAPVRLIELSALDRGGPPVSPTA